jgi:multidrug efflux pump subunit AcrA (membrane-fusion protein)
LYNPGAGAVHAIYATGNVEPSVMVPIAARTAARLVELKADEGDVKQGQLLVPLENDDLRRAIDMAEAEERYAKARLDRPRSSLNAR